MIGQLVYLGRKYFLIGWNVTPAWRKVCSELCFHFTDFSVSVRFIDIIIGNL